MHLQVLLWGQVYPGCHLSLAVHPAPAAHVNQEHQIDPCLPSDQELQKCPLAHQQHQGLQSTLDFLEYPAHRLRKMVHTDEENIIFSHSHTYSFIFFPAPFPSMKWGIHLISCCKSLIHYPTYRSSRISSWSSLTLFSFAAHWPRRSCQGEWTIVHT